MSYSKTNWQNGVTPINQINLNKIENGINTLDQNSIKSLSNVATLIDYSSRENETVETLGYYLPEDGGGAKYLIVDDDNLTADSSFVISLNNGLKAVLIIENGTADIRQLGARSQDKNDNRYDIKTYLQRYIVYLSKIDYKLKLYIPGGIWYCSKCDLGKRKGFYIYGDGGIQESYSRSTIITSLNDNQEYVLKIGDTTTTTQNWVLKGITISAKHYTYDSNSNNFVVSSTKTITNAALVLHYACFGVIDVLEIDGVIGRAMKIYSCWENFFGLLNIQNISADTAIVFDTVDTSFMEEANITDSEFKTIRFEAIAADCITFESNCLVSGVHFGNINIEPSRHQVSINTYYDDVSQFSGQSNSLINFKGGASISIDNIDCNNFSFRYYTRNNVNYIFDTLIKVTTTSQEAIVFISKIQLYYSKRISNIILQSNANTNKNCHINIAQILNRTSYDFICKLNGFAKVKIGNNPQRKYKASTIGRFIPFYQNIKLDSNQTSGMLYYDSDCMNDLNLAVFPNKQVTSTAKFFAQFYMASTTLYIIAKIPSGSTFEGYIVSEDVSHQKDFDLVGDGSYKVYTIDLSSFNSFLGTPVYIGSRSNSNNVDAKFNGYIN